MNSNRRYRSKVLQRLSFILTWILICASLGRAQLIERPLITGRQAVVTSLEPLASMAGMRILQEGGNAFDAVVAAAVAVTVVDPRMSSIGGNGFATIYVAKTHEVRALNFYGSAPKRATMELYKRKDYSHGSLSAPVPSCLLVIEMSGSFRIARDTTRIRPRPRCRGCKRNCLSTTVSSTPPYHLELRAIRRNRGTNA